MLGDRAGALVADFGDGAGAFGAGFGNGTGHFADGSRLHLAAQLSDEPGREQPDGIAGQILWSTGRDIAARAPLRDLPPWFVAFFLESTSQRS